jgi:hypothetical protein
VPTALAAVTKTIDGREVIVALIGGTMLTLALTRPQLRWMAHMPRSGKSQRLWAERALTGFSFVMGGYAAMSVAAVLYRQLGSEIDDLLKGSACFLVLYAGLVHFEPFVNEWRLRTGLGAFVLYVASSLWAVVLGASLAEFSVSSSMHLATGTAGLEATALAGGAWLFYRASAKLDAAFDRRTDSAADWLLKRLGRLPGTDDSTPR